MLDSSAHARLLKLTLSIVNELPGATHIKPLDVVVEVQPDATVEDLARVAAEAFGCTPAPTHGLVRHVVTGRPGMVTVDGASGYLPAHARISDCGLTDGMMLYLRDRLSSPAPDLRIDLDSRPDDLFLVDERGVHRGRVTRLPAGEGVTIESAPPGVPAVVVDDIDVEAHAVTLVNRGGQNVLCTVVHGTGVHVSGTPVAMLQS